MQKIDEEIFGKNKSVNDLVAYQKNSIVSRQLISRKPGTVTLFAFDQGQELSEHISPYDATVFILEGEALIQVDRKPFTVKQGEVILMPAAHPHALKAVTAFKMILILIGQEPGVKGVLNPHG